MTYILEITFHTGKVLTVRASEFHCLANGVVNYVKENRISWEKFYPEDATLKKVEISFDKSPASH